MDELNPKEILGRFPATVSQPGSDCPDDQVLTAALEGEYHVLERKAFEAHVSACQHCLGRMGRFARLKRVVEPAEISELTLARAQKLIRRTPATRRVPVWAAAAAIGFAAVLTTIWFAGPTETTDSTQMQAPEVRNIDADAYRPQVVYPREGASLKLSDSYFEWQAVPGALHYDVRIVGADGALVLQERVQGSRWILPADLPLEGGVDYYFRVDAYLTQAKSLRSRHVMFRVAKDG